MPRFAPGTRAGSSVGHLRPSANLWALVRNQRRARWLVVATASSRWYRPHHLRKRNHTEDHNHMTTTGSRRTRRGNVLCIRRSRGRTELDDLSFHIADTGVVWLSASLDRSCGKVQRTREQAQRGQSHRSVPRTGNQSRPGAEPIKDPGAKEKPTELNQPTHAA